MAALATTFDGDGETIEVEIISAPNAVGLCKALHNGSKIVRHKDRLSAVNDEARSLLGK